MSDFKEIKLQIVAGKANPSPPVGPALGQAGVNIMAFCKQFNAETQGMEPDMVLPIVIRVNKKKEFTIQYKKPPVSWFIKKLTKLAKGSGDPGKKMVGTITKTDCLKIAEQKISDLNAATLEAAARMIEGSARSMGIKVVEG